MSETINSYGRFGLVSISPSSLHKNVDCSKCVKTVIDKDFFRCSQSSLSITTGFIFDLEFSSKSATLMEEHTIEKKPF